MPCTCGSRACERHNRIQAVADTGLARDGAVFIAFVRHGDEWLPVDATGCPVGDIATRLPATREWKVCDVAAMRAVIAELEDELASVELDYQVDECVLNGTWPSAREQLTAALAKCPPEEVLPEGAGRLQ